MYTYFDAEGSQVTPEPYLATNISAASDDVCTRSKAVYTTTLWFGHRSSVSFLFSCIFIESKNKKGWRP